MVVYKGVFIGKDMSMGYKHGEIYEFTIDRNILRPVDVMLPTCPYTLSGFLTNWHVIEAMKFTDRWEVIYRTEV